MKKVEWKEEVLIDVLARTYEQIVLVDIESEKARWICGREQSEIHDYSKWCEEYMAKDYFGDDVTIFLQKIRLDAVSSTLTYEDDYVIEYSKKEDGDIRRKRLTMFWSQKETVLCLCFDDVTGEAAQAKREQELIARSLQVAYKANEIRQQFLDHMQQEMRDPLRGVDGMLDAALDAGEESCADYIAKAKECITKYFMMLEQLFAMSAIEKGELFVRDEVVMVDRMLEKVQLLLKEETAAKNIRLNMQNKTPKVNTFYLDRIHMTQLMYNLLASVMEGAGQGVEIGVEIAFEEDKETELFDMTMAVRGKGSIILPEKDQLGLGMPFVYRLVDCFSGMIRVTDAEGEGIEIEIRLPVQPVEKKEQSEAGIISHLVDHIKERDFSKYRALVVDDNEINRDITVALLRKFGLQVETAGDGQEAIDMLLASPGRYYQIMFMNPVLPNKTGFEATMELREMKRRDINDITVVALTPNGLRDERIRSLEHGMDYHIVLPQDEVELKEILIRELQDLGPRDEHEVFGFRVIK